jgi:predicted O-linked N-acetylglucosamine transferase (SPINDLY family)
LTASAAQPGERPAQASGYDEARAALDRSDLAQARALCQAVLAREPNDVDCLHLLGYLETTAGRAARGAELLRRSLKLNPDQPVALLNLAAASLELGEPQSALEFCQRCLELAPEYAQAHYLYGKGLVQLGRNEEAAQAYRRAVTLVPDCRDYLLALGAACLALGRPAAALAAFDRALQDSPNGPELLLNRGVALLELNRNSEAVSALQRAVSLEPHSGVAHNALANGLRRLGQLEGALKHYELALHSPPESADVHYNYVLALLEAGRPAAAITHMDAVVALEPRWPLGLGSLWHLHHLCCHWPRENILAEQMIEAVGSGEAQCVEPLTFLSVTDSAALQLQCARNYHPAQPFPAEQFTPHRAARTNAVPRVAYVSADFGEHPLSYLLAEVLEYHDLSKLEPYAVSLQSAVGSPTRKRIEQGFGKRFLDAQRLDDRAIADLLRELQIDIVVDLGGLTRGARPALLAARVAPLQISYLGYPGTLGMPAMDYIIGDAFVVPEGHEQHYREAIIRLPICFQANDSKRGMVLPLRSRAEFGLAQDATVYCSFNSLLKLNEPMFDAWLEILQAVPGAVLWLFADNEGARQNLRRMAAQRGIEAGRLLFAERESYDAHLARLRLADIFLDSFPFNGGSTVSDALWCGVPVVTLAGDSFASRMAGSLLHALRVPELITTDLESYRAKAIELGRDLPLRTALRGRLLAEDARSRVFDAKRFCRELESAYHQIWQRYLDGKAPQVTNVTGG